MLLVTVVQNNVKIVNYISGGVIIIQCDIIIIHLQITWIIEVVNSQSGLLSLHELYPSQFKGGLKQDIGY